MLDVNDFLVIVQAVGSVVNSLVFVALMLGFPSSAEVPIRKCRMKIKAAYFTAIVVVPALNAVMFSKATLVKSSFTLVEGYPVGRIHAVVLSTHSTATDFPVFVMTFLIRVLETYCADMVVRSDRLASI